MKTLLSIVNRIALVFLLCIGSFVAYVNIFVFHVKEFKLNCKLSEGEKTFTAKLVNVVTDQKDRLLHWLAMLQNSPTI